MSFPFCPVEGCLAAFIFGIQVDAVGDQHFCDCLMSCDRGLMQRGMATARFGIDVSARLKQGFPQFDEFFVPTGADRLRSLRGDLGAAVDEPVGLMSLRIADLMTRDPVTVQQGQSVRDAARLAAVYAAWRAA